MAMGVSDVFVASIPGFRKSCCLYRGEHGFWEKDAAGPSILDGDDSTSGVEVGTSSPSGDLDAPSLVQRGAQEQCFLRLCDSANAKSQLLPPVYALYYDGCSGFLFYASDKLKAL